MSPFRSGVRIAEAVYLQWGTVLLEPGLISVEHAVEPWQKPSMLVRT